MRSESGKALAAKKDALERTLLKTISSFEDETGLSVTEIRVSRNEVGGAGEPTLQRIFTTVELITA